MSKLGDNTDMTDEPDEQSRTGQEQNDNEAGGTYRVFCAYGHRGREPGCGWERFVDDEAEAKRLAENHREGHQADYERYSDTGKDHDE